MLFLQNQFLHSLNVTDLSEKLASRPEQIEKILAQVFLGYDSDDVVDRGQAHIEAEMDSDQNYQAEGLLAHELADVDQLREVLFGLGGREHPLESRVEVVWEKSESRDLDLDRFDNHDN